MTPPSTAGTAPDPASGSSDPVAAAGTEPGAGPVGPSAVKPTLGALRRGGAAAGAGTDPSSGERPDAPGASGRSEPPEPTPTPAPTPPEPSAAPAPPTGPFPTRDQLVQAWGDHVIGRLRPKAKALFQAGRFVGVDGERAVFGLPNETHRSRCEEVRGEIEAALADQFGRPIGLELVVDPGAEPPRSRPAAPQEPPRPAPAGTTATGTGSGNGRERQGADRAGSTGPSGPVPPPTAARATEAHEPHLGDDPDVLDDPADFDESELGELVDVDNSAEARVRLAFPGAEEVG